MVAHFLCRLRSLVFPGLLYPFHPYFEPNLYTRALFTRFLETCGVLSVAERFAGNPRVDGAHALDLSLR